MGWKASVMVLAAIGAAGATAASAATDSPGVGSAGEEASVAPAPAGIPDLTGYWKLDPARSVVPARPERSRSSARAGGPRREGGFPRRGPGERPGPGGGEPGDGPGRPLPYLFHVTQSEQVVSFEDSTGTVVQEVALAAGDSIAHAPGARLVAGSWHEGRLRVERPGGRGGTVTETIALEDGGATLVIRTERGGAEGRPAMRLERVYRKVTEW